MSVSGKRKEIYKYLAPWPLYSMNWSVRPDKRFRLALGSFVEEYNNKVQIVSLDEDTSEFSAKRYKSTIGQHCNYINHSYHILALLIIHIPQQKLCGYLIRKGYSQIY